jgi:hypothetical protein
MNKITMTLLIIGLSGMLIPFRTSAVHINHKGLGDVAIIPYYTVNNNLNTLVSVTNTTTDGKAIKINIREGLHGYATLSYNVYLDGNDTWTFALFPTDSTVSGYEGQESASHATADTSCAPYLNKSGQEFLPFELTDGPNNLQRTREGFIEVIEMGSITPTSPAFSAAHHGSTPVPANCTYFIQAWQENGIWHEDSGGNSHTNLSPTTGGLMVEAQLVDVADGINYSIPTITLDGFHADATIAHVNPGETSLSLDAAEPVAQVIANRKTYQLQFDSAIDAVSAVLMSDKLMATYALDSIVDGKTEVVYTQPTRRFYLGLNNLDAEPPFNSMTSVPGCESNSYGGIEINQTLFDRESQKDIDPHGTIGTPPPTIEDAICGLIFVQNMILPGQTAPANSSITHSSNFSNVLTPDIPHATQNGYIQTEFLGARHLDAAEVNTGAAIELHGIPIIGVSLQRFTNAGAAEGLLVQYGGAQLFKSTTKVIESE